MLLAMPSPDSIIDILVSLDPMTDLPRTGWLLRGVASVESLAAHSFGVALVAMLLLDLLREEGRQVDGERTLRLALLHDAAEAKTGDIPMPHKTPALDAALHQVESRIVDEMFPPEHAELWRESAAGQSLEARIVKASDKIQMMVKVWLYEERRGAKLDEFWQNPKNFRDGDLPEARALYAAIARRAGRELPAEVRA